MFKRFLVGLLIVVGIAGSSHINHIEVNAENDVAHCIWTKDNRFFCEGNPGYERELAKFKAGR